MKVRTKRTLLISVPALLLLSLVVCGSESSRLGVKAKGSHEYMFVSGDGVKAWYSALELEQIAGSYVATKRIKFDFEDTEKHIWVNTDGRRVLADVYFSAAIGKPTLHVEIGRDGNVIGHKIEVHGE